MRWVGEMREVGFFAIQAHEAFVAFAVALAVRPTPTPSAQPLEVDFQCGKESGIGYVSIPLEPPVHDEIQVLLPVVVDPPTIVSFLPLLSSPSVTVPRCGVSLSFTKVVVNVGKSLEAALQG